MSNRSFASLDEVKNREGSEGLRVSGEVAGAFSYASCFQTPAFMLL